MVTMTEEFSFFEKSEEEESYSGFSLHVKNINIIIHERNEFNHYQLSKRTEKFFVTTGDNEELSEAKGFETEEEAVKYAEKAFSKKLASLIHNLQELQEGF